MSAVLAPSVVVESLAAWRGRHAGADVVVCGCGESLAGFVPGGVLTIGVNDVGRRFTPDYLVVVNPRRQFAPERWPHVAATRAQAVFTQLDDLGFTPARQVRFRLGRHGGHPFEGDADTLPYTRNSPYVAVALAAALGARRIGLVGVDFGDAHFFGTTGPHALARRLPEIDAEYGRLREALAARGVELVNLSPCSRLASLPRAAALGAATAAPPVKTGLRIVSYATTPVAGVPALLARCIAHATPHAAACVWAADGYGNGIRFAGAPGWGADPRRALAELEAADLLILHNGKVDPAHERVVAAKPRLTLAHNYGWNVDLRHVQAGMPGLVVAQYQATLPEFAGWHVVPNPLPLWDADHAPGAKGARVTVAYTPSGRHESYPPGHRLYWHAKGFATTMAALESLARRHDIAVETTADGAVAHAEALAMKRRAHVVVDECATGSYHRNSLEALAAAAVVVNGVGRLPGVEAALRRCAPDAGALPFVGCGLAELEATLEALVALGPDTLAARGRDGRAWLERHWDFGAQWARLWQPAVDEALARGRAAARPPPPPVPAPRHQEAMRLEDPLADRVSVVVPHGGAERLPLLAATLANLAQAPEVTEVVVVELGTAPLAAAVAARWGARHCFVAHEGAFERARALNAGTALAREAVVCWHDNDLLHAPGFLARAAGELRRRGLDALVAYADVRYLSPEDSAAVQRGELAPEAATAVATIRSQGPRPAWIGCVGLVRRDFVARHGGLVEGFRGWGGEDDAWFHKARLLGRIAATEDPAQTVWHLHHALSGGVEPGAPGAANPHYAANVERLHALRALRDGAAFARAFPPVAPAVGRLREPPALRPAARAAGLPVWTYWEGPCPAWIRACRRTMQRHLPALRLLDRESFDALRADDADASGLDLSHLHVAHRADAVRAYLLQRFGGLWIDADCVVLQPLDEVLALLARHDFVAHRARGGVLSNAFIGAPAGSRIAAAYWARVRRAVAAKQRFSWNWLGGDLLTEVVRGDDRGFHELPASRIQPVCWSRPEAFLAAADEAVHDAARVPDAWTYMLSNVELGKRFADGRDALMAPRSFFRHLLRRALGCDAGLEASLLREQRAADAAALFARHRCESVSGTGSSLGQTAWLRRALPLALQHLGVRTLLDAPCGDRHWMRRLRMPGVEGIALDILSEQVAALAERGEAGWRFVAGDLVDGAPLPRADAVLCRDLMPHLSFAQIAAVVARVRESGATWLLATTFGPGRANADRTDGGWRPLDLQAPPFDWPAPVLRLVEGCTEDGGRYADKALGVWPVAALPVP